MVGEELHLDIRAAAYSSISSISTVHYPILERAGVTVLYVGYQDGRIRL
jgi:hypothetical protein